MRQRVKDASALAERKEKRKRQKKVTQCLYHGANYCTCGEKVLSKPALNEKVLNEIAWREKSYAVNPYQFRKEYEEAQRLKEEYGF